FQAKLMSLTGGFWIYDEKDQQFAELKGNWSAREFKFVKADGKEIGSVGKKWAGLATELFTGAGTYLVACDDSVAKDTHAKLLMLAAALAINIVLYAREAHR